MKNKNINLLSLLLVCLSGCNVNNSTSSNSTSINRKELSILTPTGAPAAAFLNYLNDENYTTNDKPNNIVAEMLKGSNDIVVVDLIGGLTAIEMKDAPYKLASIITFGNFYIYATGNDKDKIMSNEDNIVCFGQNNTPDTLFKHLFEDIEIDTYVNGVVDISPVAASGIINGENVDYCVIAEPVLYTILNKKDAATYGKGYEYADFQKLWKEKHSENSTILGASIYVKNDTYNTYNDQINEFLNNIEKDINNYVSNCQIACDKLNEFGSPAEQGQKIGINSTILKGVLEDNNSINLGYLSSKNENFNSIVNEYLTVVNPQIINEKNYL